MNTKPEYCCYPDCFHCPYDDCHYDRLEHEDFKDNNIEEVDQHGADGGHPTDEAGLGNKALIAADGVAAARAADRRLDLHHGICQQDGAHDEADHERAAAVVIGQVGEFPDVTQAYRCACGNHDVTEPGSPLLGLLLGFDLIAHCRYSHPFNRKPNVFPEGKRNVFSLSSFALLSPPPQEMTSRD